MLRCIFKMIIILINSLLLINEVYAGWSDTGLKNLYVIVKPGCQQGGESIHLQFRDYEGLTVKYKNKIIEIGNIAKLKAFTTIQNKAKRDPQVLAIPYIFLHPYKRLKYEFNKIFASVMAGIVVFFFRINEHGVEQDLQGWLEDFWVSSPWNLGDSMVLPVFRLSSWTEGKVYLRQCQTGEVQLQLSDGSSHAADEYTISMSVREPERKRNENSGSSYDSGVSSTGWEPEP